MREIFSWGVRRPSDFFTASLLRLGLALFVSLAALTNTAQAAQATPDETAATTMQVFVAIADLAGAPIPKEAVPVVQGMVTCALNNTALPECVKNIAISTALSQIAKEGGLDPKTRDVITGAVTCLTGGQAAQTCMLDPIVRQLPAEAQPLASCIGHGGDVGTCAERAALTEATRHLPPEAASVVGCVANGAALASCATRLVTDGVNKALNASGAPPEVVNAVNGMVNCVSDGGNAATCAKKVAIDSIPPGQAKELATCMNAAGANAQTCVANFAANNIDDPTAKAVVGCMGQTSGDAVQQCIATNAKAALGDAASQAGQQALMTAAKTIEDLQIGAAIQNPPKFPEQPAILQNIMAVAQGIEQGNWLLVVKGVGPEAAEVAAKIILSIFLTPALANVLSPVVDSMIQNDVNAFTNGVEHLRNGDAVGVAQDIFKWYETQYIQAPCALMPDGAFKNSVCNALADGINWVANAGGDLAKGILGVGKDVLQALGLWNMADDVASFVWDNLTSVISDIGRFLGLGSHETKVVCVGFPSPSDYFANTVVNSCLASATSSAASSPAALGRTVSSVVSQCTSLYGLCATSNQAKAAVQANCGRMGDALSQMASSSAGALRNAASAYARTAVGTFAAKKYAEFKKKGNPEDICSSDFWSSNAGEFDASCAAVVGAKLNMPADACPSRPTYDAATQACATSLRNASYLTDAVTGPRGALCKKFKEDAAKNPCQFTDKTKIVLPSGQVIATNLECHFIKPPWLGAGLPMGPMGPKLRPAPWADGGLGGVFRLPPIRWFPPVGGVLVNLNPKDPPRVLQPFPKVGGATLPRPNIKFPSDGRATSATRVTGRDGSRPDILQPSRGGTGGANGSRAMDILGDANTGGAMGGAAGAGSGGIGDGRPRAGGTLPNVGLPPKLKLPREPNVATAPSGGTGGWNGTNSQSGNAPTGSGGSNMVNSQSGNSPSQRYRPTTKLGVRPSNGGVDSRIDYGGCSSCNSRSDDLHVR